MTSVKNKLFFVYLEPNTDIMCVLEMNRCLEVNRWDWEAFWVACRGGQRDTLWIS